MDEHAGGSLAGSPTSRELKTLGHSWLVVFLSGSGVLLILLGLLAVALPPSYEGPRLWQLATEHTVYLADALGGMAMVLGGGMIWVGSRLWNRRLLS